MPKREVGVTLLVELRVEHLVLEADGTGVRYYMHLYGPAWSSGDP